MTCFPDDVLVGQDLDHVAERLGHLLDAVRAQDHGRVGEHRLRLDEVLAVAAVEGAHDLARQLQVRGLVLADRHAARVVDRDVGRLEDRVGQQRVVDVVRLGAHLLLEGRRALDPADGHDGRKQVGQLGVLGPVRLAEEDGALGSSPSASNVIAMSRVLPRMRSESWVEVSAW